MGLQDEPVVERNPADPKDCNALVMQCKSDDPKSKIHQRTPIITTYKMRPIVPTKKNHGEKTDRWRSDFR
jgi:hypothetical protein